jgi:TolB-like protein/thioredoxin-like negative regulator of GroEL
VKGLGRIKHYELLSQLGEGGMGVVYRARDTRLGRVVAIKMLHKELAGDEERTRRFEREARIISAMSHPGIATLYEFDRDADVTFLAMELVEGPTLREQLGGETLPLDQALDCALQIAEALAAAHKEGVIHRDLKPENIMIADTGYYKVLDFGVARVDESKPDEAQISTQTPTVSWATRAGGIVGTVTYMSPEQALGEPVDARSDIFSFGSLLYEVLAGKPAFRGNNEIATAQAIVNAEPEPLSSLRPGIPRGVELVIQKCLAKRAADRYQSTDALVADLRELRLDRLSGTPALRRLHAYRTAPSRRRRLWLLGGAAAVALAALVTIGVWQPWRVPAETVVLPVPATAEAIPASAPERPRVVVSFFENNSGDAAADWLSRGLPEMLTTELSRSKDLEVIATQRLHDLLASAGRDPDEIMDRSTASELARWAGADIVISGSVFRAGRRYRIDAQAYDTASGAVTVAHKVEGEDLFVMVDELTSDLREGLQVSSVEAAPLLMVTTSSEEAFRHYARGREYYDSLDLEAAEEQFNQSLDADPDFALARLRLALSMVSRGELDSATPLLVKTESQVERLPEADRMLSAALHSYVAERDLEATTKGLEALVRAYPSEQEAHVVWARALSDLADDPVEATRKLRKALAQDPGNLPVVAALAQQLAALGETEAARGLIEEARRRNPQAGEALTRLLEDQQSE